MRPVYSVDNTSVRDFLQQFNDIYDSSSFFNLAPDWLQDCIRGATGQMPGTQRVSCYKLFSILRAMDNISTPVVTESLNRKKIAIEGVGYSQRTIDYYTSMLRCASQAISHHLSQNPKAIIEQKQIPVDTVKYTEEQMCVIRGLAVAGKLEELDEYVKSLCTNVIK